MLGSLARWLRFCGFDCTYYPQVSSSAVLQHAQLEQRWLLTRDRGLAHHWQRTLVVTESTIEKMLCEVLARVGVVPLRDLTQARCSVCNEALTPLETGQARGRAPEYVLERATSVLECPGCGRLYWEGSHSRRILARIDRVRAALTDERQSVSSP